jgi:sugar phosphate isomerase/epimerase
MKKLTRRNFVTRSAMGFGAIATASLLPKELLAQANLLDIPVGFQSWAIRESIPKDFIGILKTMSGLGYKLVELCSPPSYADNGFGSLVNMKPNELRKTISDAGLSCPSCHFGLKELNENLDERIEWAHGLGLEHMVCSSFGLPKGATLTDYKAAAEQLNKAAEKIKKAGMQAGFHNHEMEFATLDGKLIYDELMSTFNPDLVKMQFQTEVINLGYKASTYFDKYPGRFISSHLSDWTADKKQAPIGKGIIDWKEFFASAKKAGVKYFFVEMDFDTFKDSAEFIKNLKV